MTIEIKDKTVKEIITTLLKENGYDGLVNTDLECGCTIDDGGIFPCDSSPDECKPAFRVKCDCVSCDARENWGPSLIILRGIAGDAEHCMREEKPQ